MIKMKKNNIRHTAVLGLLTAVGLIIFTIEGLLPPLTPIPGIKLGLANIVTLYALYALSPRDAAAVSILRILLAAIFAGQAVSLWYSLAGGIFCLISMTAAKKLFSEEYMEFTSIVGALFHNMGQLLAAVLLLENTAILLYFPFLALGGVVCGLFTGIGCKITYKRLKNVLSQ